MLGAGDLPTVSEVQAPELKYIYVLNKDNDYNGTCDFAADKMDYEKLYSPPTLLTLSFVEY